LWTQRIRFEKPSDPERVQELDEGRRLAIQKRQEELYQQAKEAKEAAEAKRQQKIQNLIHTATNNNADTNNKNNTSQNNNNDKVKGKSNYDPTNPYSVPPPKLKPKYQAKQGGYNPLDPSSSSRSLGRNIRRVCPPRGGG
jgi:type II secretory pathway pseudopilin PulG